MKGNIAVDNYEKEHEAEWDADALIKAAEIRMDPKRLKAAKAVLKKRKEATAMAAGATKQEA